MKEMKYSKRRMRCCAVVAAMLSVCVTVSAMILLPKAVVEASAESAADAVISVEPNYLYHVGDDVDIPRIRAFASAVSYGGSYRSELSDNGKAIYDAFVQHFITEDPAADGTDADFDGSFSVTLASALSSTDGLNDVFYMASAAFLYDHPEVYWIRDTEIPEQTITIPLTTFTAEASLVYPGGYAQRHNFAAAVPAGKSCWRFTITSAITPLMIWLPPQTACLRLAVPDTAIHMATLSRRCRFLTIRRLLSVRATPSPSRCFATS